MQRALKWALGGLPDPAIERDCVLFEVMLSLDHLDWRFRQRITCIQVLGSYQGRPDSAVAPVLGMENQVFMRRVAEAASVRQWPPTGALAVGFG